MKALRPGTSSGQRSPRRDTIVIALLCGTLAALIAPSTATALGRRQADRLAVHALSPTHVVNGLGVVIYGLPAALPAADSVEVFQARAHQKLSKHPLGHRTWLFWEDLAPGAMFAHASRLLLVDDHSGKVVQRRRLEWWPLIDGIPPPFLTGGEPVPHRYVVFSSVGARKRARSSTTTRSGPTGPRHGTHPAPNAGRNPGVPLAWGAVADPFTAHRAQLLQITPQQLEHDCLITVGLEQANLSVKHGSRVENVRPLTNDFTALREWADSVGLKTYDGGDSTTSLDDAVTAAIDNTPCNDVFIFLGGHGVPPPGAHKEGLDTVNGTGGPAGVLTRAQYVPPPGGGRRGGSADTQMITPEDLVKIMAKHDRTKPVSQRATFKIKIDSCFAGRFVPELQTASNLEFLEVSSAADETSFFHLAEGADVRQDGRTVHVANDTDNPHDVTEFMNRDLHGLETWASSQQAHDNPDLANGLANAFTLGAASDFAASIGYSTPTRAYSPGALDTTFPPPPPPPPAPVAFGSDLASPSDGFGKATVDFVLWLLGDPNGSAARVASASSASAPTSGQITQVTVRGNTAKGSPSSTILFQDLRPQPGGGVQVIATSQPFTLPEAPGTYPFVPTNFFVQAGDYVGLASIGGEFEVLVGNPTATTAMFEGHNQDVNGAQFTSNMTLTGEELNMQMTLQPSG